MEMGYLNVAESLDARRRHVTLDRSRLGCQLVRRHRTGARHCRPQAQPVTEHDQRRGDGRAQFAEYLADRLRPAARR
jgi:hypothetical protein